MQSGPLLLLEADSPEKASSVVLQRTDIQDYAWSPNSQKLAVAASDSRKVAILDMGEKRRGAIQVNTDCAVMYLALTHDSSGLVVAGAESDKGWFVLRKVDLATGASRIIFRHEGRIRDITPLEDGSVVFRAVSEGTGKLMVAAPDGNCEPLPFGEGTTSLLAANEAKRALYAAHTGIVTPLGLYEMNVDRRTSRLVFQPSPLQGVRGTAPATAYVSIPNGPTLPVRVWRSKTRPPRGAIIVFPNGRGDEKGSPVYSGSIQYFVQKGYDYIAFDFQPNGEEALNEMDIRYSLAVIDYARNQLGASPEKTVLYGGSLATNYVVETARHLRETAGGLVLRGITRSASDGESGFDHGFRVAAFQGENDPVSPATARAYLECVFGPRALSGANGFFYILQNEGHTPRLLSSRALVYAGIVELLER